MEMNNTENLVKDACQYNNFYDFLKVTCDLYGQRKAISIRKGDITRNITYENLYLDSILVAKKLFLKYKDTKHIGVICDNSYEYIVFVFALMIKGSTAVLIEHNVEEDELNGMLSRTDTECLFMPDMMHEFVNRALNEETDYVVECPVVKISDAAIILFTSGTTSNRHAVVLSHNNVLQMFKGARGIYNNESYENMIVYVALPLFHMYGITAILCNLERGFRSYICQDFRRLWSDISEIRPNAIEGVPDVLEFIQVKLKRKKSDDSVLKQLDIITSGGAFLKPELAAFFESRGVIVSEGYGLTETSTFVAVNNSNNRKLGTVGTISSYNEVEIIDGEICVRGDNVMKGYYGEDEYTKQVIYNGWFHTGDLGFIDEDGFLHITGRCKNIIICSNGENISPEMIENKLLSSSVITEVIVSQDDKGILADVFSSLILTMDYNEVYELVRDAVEQYNRGIRREYRVLRVKLREMPFEKTKTQKIKRE